MGLDAHVRCNCMKEGIAAPYPMPELLRFDEDGEPYPDWKKGLSQSQWAAHEQWMDTGCQHKRGYIVSKRLGNMGSIAHVRAYIQPLVHTHFPLLMAKVVYSGIHGGDWIPAAEVGLLLKEVRFLMEAASDPHVKEFAADMIEVCEASLATGNPIVF